MNRSPAQLRRISVREQTRARFLESAERAFRESSYELVTVEQVAAAAGYSKRSIYLYFRDKRDLFEHVLSRELAHWNEQLRLMEKGETEALIHLELILIECFGYVDRDPVIFRHLLESWSLAISNPIRDIDPMSGASQLADRTTDLLRTFTRCLDRAVIEGTLSSQSDPSAEASWIWSQIVGALITTSQVKTTNRSESLATTRRDASKRILSTLTNRI